VNDPNPIHDPVEEAALYVAGALPPEEAAAVEARLAEGDDALAAEVASYDAVVRALCGRGDDVPPDPGTRRALLDLVSRRGAGGRGGPPAQPPRVTPPAGVFIRRGGSTDWRAYEVPGIHFCVLRRDPDRNLQTTLFRVAPGVEIPGHPHPVDEECYVLDGDFHSHGTTLFAGDYMRAPAGSRHEATYTEGGCYLLVVSEVRGA
jgi:anti-sigma factor ChrR (cupin superfamily)